MLLIFFLLLQLNVLLHDGIAIPYGHSHHNGYSNSHGYNRHKSNHWKPRKPHITRTNVMMPSGVMNMITIPTNSPKWNCADKSKLIELKPTGKMGKIEYNIVKTEMEKTGSGLTFNIIKIEKIVNSCLWKRYLYRQQDVIREAVANERMLWHGSRAALTLVDKGFDERYASLGGYFGPGLYFAEHSSKSHGYTGVQADGTRLMLLCRVTLGNMFITTTGNRFPHAPVGYHSVKGAIAVPEYMVYRGEQAYPEYLITYK